MSEKIEEKKNIVAAFDFDKTITYRDALVPFLWRIGGFSFIWKIVFCLPAFAAHYLLGWSRGRVKAFVLARFIKGKSVEWLEGVSCRFVEEVIPNFVLPKAMQRVRWHQEQGHRVMVVSANLEIFLKYWIRKVGIKEVIATRLEVDSRGKFTGKFEGKNCYGPEKKNRLEKLLGDREGYILYAYGDSRGDQEMLEMADFPFYREMPALESDAVKKGE